MIFCVNIIALSFGNVNQNTPNKSLFLEEVKKLAKGYSFHRRNEMSKALFLIGEGTNGKSTFIDILNNVAGDGNKSSLGLEELDERFSIEI